MDQTRALWCRNDFTVELSRMHVFAAKGRTGTRRTHVPSGTLCRSALAALHIGLVFVVDGEPVWANRVAASLLGPDAEPDGPWGEVGRTAAQLPRPTGRRVASSMRSLGSLRTVSGRVRVCGVRLASPRGESGDVVMIALEIAHRRPPGDVQLRHRFGLTPQELQVARLLAEGLTNARVAGELGIAPNTARIHTERVMRKLGVHSRAAVASALMHP